MKKEKDFWYYWDYPLAPTFGQKAFWVFVLVVGTLLFLEITGRADIF